ncbi:MULTISPECIES: copper chaperone PCu(A)C [Chromobacterium]|uniref:Copper chaperone PCu(A)C n=1 Tax=Chromobacterium aquaticum TaxID=467180 RepID=A0ABV8ZXU5_9NEIS|nr:MULTISPECIES: copper chaperone PCu(A)C [Chromobacterium]KMN37486.1 membrane protein [Chromobacterium sp. LK1]MCD5361369.1 copper chaperone PCu(A)C [Chromobacterium aquaticum]
MKKTLSALLGLCLLSAGAMAHEFKLGDLKIGHPWSRAMPESSPTGGVYLLLSNRGKTADKLLSASTPRAAKAELHTHINDNGVMRMREVAGGVEVAAGQQVKFAPGSYHVMLMGLKQPLRAGDHFPLTLRFEKAGSVTVDVAVEDGVAPAAEHAH